MGIILLILLLVPVFRTAEPEYKGVGLSSYLASNNARDYGVAIEAAKAIGPAAVSYLTVKIDRQPLLELLIHLLERLPASFQKLLPSQNTYQVRRMRAASVLAEFGTNAVPALPTALEIIETEGPSAPRYSSIVIVGTCGPDTEYEERALQALLRATESPVREEQKIALTSLGRFTNHLSDVLPVLINGIKVPGLYGSAEAGLKRLGTQAIPTLQELSAKEEGHIRPATAALESLTNAVAKAK
jgi:hypothetical protein